MKKWILIATAALTTASAIADPGRQCTMTINTSTLVDQKGTTHHIDSYFTFAVLDRKAARESGEHCSEPETRTGGGMEIRDVQICISMNHHTWIRTRKSKQKGTATVYIDGQKKPWIVNMREKNQGIAEEKPYKYYNELNQLVQIDASLECKNDVDNPFLFQ